MMRTMDLHLPNSRPILSRIRVMDPQWYREECQYWESLDFEHVVARSERSNPTVTQHGYEQLYIRGVDVSDIPPVKEIQ